MKKGKLFVISGASGVGKGTVLDLVMKERKDLIFSVSATTRDPRNKEQDGIHYYFVSRETFQDMIQAGEFLEYDEHGGYFYGTPRAQAEEKRTRGHVIFDIEPNGAKGLRESCPDATLIFIMPPSLEELERRLRQRKTDSEADIQKRLARAPWEMEQRHWYDHVVVNDVAEDCAREILNIIAQKADE